jgi:hypothetical protein
MAYAQHVSSAGWRAIARRRSRLGDLAEATPCAAAEPRRATATPTRRPTIPNKRLQMSAVRAGARAQ